MDLYEVADVARRTFLIDLARSARQQSNWWSVYRDIVPSPEYLDFLGYENDAATLHYYAPLIVPGLVQTEEYARAVFQAGTLRPFSESTIERLVQLRMARKQYVMDRDDPPNFTAILETGAIRRPIGGGDVMNDQLTSIAELATLPDVTIHIISPLWRGAHPGLVGAFQIMEFADSADAPVLQFDTAPGRHCGRAETLALYRDGYEALHLGLTSRG